MKLTLEELEIIKAALNDYKYRNQDWRRHGYICRLGYRVLDEIVRLGLKQ